MVLYCLKSKNEVGLQFSSIENAEIIYCCGFITGHARIKYSWGFKLLEMLKYGTIGVLYCSKRKYKVQLGSPFTEKADVMIDEVLFY